MPAMLLGDRTAWARRLDRHPASACALAALLGLGVALFIYPPAFIAGNAARFHSFEPFPTDAVEYWLAWRALAEHGRPWPSVWSDFFNHPNGFPITISDGLPLAATLFRPFLRWLPDGFHYFGLWTVFAVLMQGIAGAVLVRAAGVRHILPCLAAAGFALCMPIFVGRLGQSHVTLSTQGLLILSIALCVYVFRQRPTLAFALFSAAALALTALAVHPLLGLQVLLFGLLAAGLAPGSVSRRLGAALALLVLATVLLWALGIFSLASFGNSLALGSFGFSPLAMLLGEPNALREVHQVPGPEQDAWLGWGCVLLLAMAIFPRPRARVRNAPLAWTVLALAVLAVSPWLRHGLGVIDLSSLLPDFVIDLYAMHRAAVRLAWPAVICLSILPLAHIANAWPRRRAALVLCSALALQLVSITPYWAHEHRQARLPVPSLAPVPALLDGATRLLIAPGPEGLWMGTLHLRHAMHLALETGAPLAGGMFARPPPGYLAHRRQDLAGPPTPGTYYLAVAPPGDALAQSLPLVPHPLVCARWEVLLACRAEQLPSANGPSASNPA